MSVLASAVLFGARLSWAQAVGLFVCLGGAFGYSLIKAKKKDAQVAVRKEVKKR